MSQVDLQSIRNASSLGSASFSLTEPHDDSDDDRSTGDRSESRGNGTPTTGPDFKVSTPLSQIELKASTPLSQVGKAKAANGKTLRRVQSKSDPISVALEPDNYKVDKPDDNTIQEIVGCLKVKTSMLAIGACERVKKIARVHPTSILNSPVFPELVSIVQDGPGTPLAGVAMSAMTTLALVPEGRQRLALAGIIPSLIKMVGRGETSRPNVGKAMALLMNIAADTGSRRMMRESGGLETLISVLASCDLDDVADHAMGALHNLLLNDPKTKMRAVDCGILEMLLRILAADLEEDDLLAVRARMLVMELVRLPGVDARFTAGAAAAGLKLS